MHRPYGGVNTIYHAILNGKTHETAKNNVFVECALNYPLRHVSQTATVQFCSLCRVFAERLMWYCL